MMYYGEVRSILQLHEFRGLRDHARAEHQQQHQRQQQQQQPGQHQLRQQQQPGVQPQPERRQQLQPDVSPGEEKETETRVARKMGRRACTSQLSTMRVDENDVEYEYE